MTQEERKLLLIDLSARLPYGVKALVIEEGEHKYKKGIIESIGTHFVPLVTPHDDVLLHFFDKNGVLGNPKTDLICFSTDEIKPYLRPLSSMTEEEKNTYDMFFNEDGLLNTSVDAYIDWLNKKMFDHRGLIPMGLALPAREGMYSTK